MLEKNRRYGMVRLLAGLFLVIILIGGGYMLYQAGFTQGAVAAGDGNLDFSRLPYGYPYHMRGPFFFPGGFIVGLVLLFVIFGVIRRVFFATHWGGNRMHHGRWQEKAEEWHLELHNRMEGQADQSDDTANQAE